MNLALQVTISWGMTMMIVMHAKDELYHDRYLENVFILFTIKVFKHLYQ
jgi:hypothetical protein